MSNLRVRMFVYIVRFVCMMISVPLHESAHALAASRLGDDTARRQGRLSLNPLAHFSPLGAVCFLLLGVGWATPVPVDARNFRRVSPRAGMALTAAAGPITNLLLAFLAVVGYKLLYYIGPVNTLTNLLLYVMNALAVMNLALAALNLLPRWTAAACLALLCPAGYSISSLSMNSRSSLWPLRCCFSACWTAPWPGFRVSCGAFWAGPPALWRFFSGWAVRPVPQCNGGCAAYGDLNLSSGRV